MIDPHEIDPLAYLAELPDDLDPVARRKGYKIIKPSLIDLYETDRAGFALAAELVKAKLKVSRRDLEADLRPLLATEEKKKKPCSLARFSGLVDLVDDGGEVRFLIHTENGHGLDLLDAWRIDDKTYVPPAKDLLPWLLPRAEQVFTAHETDDATSLFADLVSYYKSLSELPSSAYYKLLAAFTFHTYTLDFPQTTHSPELVLHAVPERGKSRTGKAITHVAMRALRTETLREANIFRWSEDLGATIFFDVLNLWKKAEREKSEDILLNRFEKGAKAARVLYPEKGRFEDTRYFDIFGATIIATNESVHKILDTRCLTITMPPARRRFEIEPTPELGLPLRERLVAWRAHQTGKPLPELAKAHAGRLGDITLPLLRVVRLVAPDAEDELRELFAAMEKERLTEKSRTLEGDILAALQNLAPEVRNGKLALKRVVETLNAERAEKEAVTPRFVSPRLRSLGFQLTSRNPADLVWNQELLEHCLVSYGIITPSRAPETSSQSSQSSQNPSSRNGDFSGSAESVESNESVERQKSGGGGDNDCDGEALTYEEIEP